MNTFQIIAAKTILDTYDNVDISLNFQIEDILDITKRNSSYSKTIKIPGTPINNTFFKRIFDVNIDAAFFNPVKKIYCELRIGDNQIITGDLQLIDILIDNKLVEYEVVITGQLKTILTDFGDLTLRNLDLSEYNHTRSQQNIQNSWTYNIKNQGVDTQYVEPGTGYVYPYIINGNSTDVYDRLYTYDLFPSVYVKTVIDKIFDSAGYTYTSNFFNSDYFKKLILPYVNDKIEKDEETINNQTTIVGVNGSNDESTPALSNEWSYFPLVADYPTGYRNISPIMKHGYGWYKNSNFTYFIGLDRESGTVGDDDFQDPLGSWDNNTSQSTPYSVYTCQASGYYDINFNSQIIIKYQNIASPFSIEFQSGQFKYYYRLLRVNTNGSSSFISQSQVETFQPSFTPPAISPVYDLDNPLPFILTASNVFLEEGDRLFIEFGIEYPESVNWVGDDDDILVQALIKESLDGIPTTFKVVPSSNNDNSVNTPINMNQILSSQVKIKDFFLDIVKMFNLVVADNAVKPNDFIIEPREDYYNSRPKVNDWTYILDNDSEIKIVPMSELDAKIYSYTYTQDDDYYNNQYYSDIKRIYGDSFFEVENDFSNETTELKLGFSPTPNAQLYIGDRVAPFFIDLNDNQMTPRKVNTRILFYGGLQSTNNTYILKDFPNQSNTLGTNLNVYPYCGMWDDPFNPQYDLSFDNPYKTYYQTDQFPVHTLIDKFHNSTFRQITNINSRLMEAFFYLTPKDISQFDFRDIILINNAYWRVNKIVDYNPVAQDRVTKVVLFKITDLKIFSPDRIEIPKSNSSCPTDIVGKKSKTGRPYYVSASGQVVSPECCSSLAGTYKNGVCWANKILPRPPYDPISSEGVVDKIRISYNGTPISEVLTTNNMKNNNSPNSPDVIIKGRGNFIGNNVKSGVLIGNNSSMPSGNNIISIGDGLTATEDNTIYLDRIKINNNGIVENYVYIIDAGSNEVMNVGKTNLIDKLDGGENSVRNFGGDSKLRPIIDGSISPFGSVTRP
jgi:hypothetical protein